MSLVNTAAHRRRRSVCIFLVMGCLGTWAHATPSTDSAEPYSLTTLMTLAAQRSPAVAQSQLEIDATRARFTQASQRPNPRLELAAKRDASVQSGGEYSTALGVSQTLPMGGRIQRQQEVARIDIALSELSLLDVKRVLNGTVAQHFYALQTERVQLASRTDFIATQQAFLAALKQRVPLGEVSALDVATLQLDLDKLEQERYQLESQQLATRQALNIVLNRPADAPLNVAQENPQAERLPVLPSLLKHAELTRTDVRKALLSVDRAQAAVALAQAQRWEDWNAGIGLEQSRQVIEGAPSQSPSRAISVSLSIPLPLTNKNQGAVAQANAELQQAKLAEAAVKLQLQNEVTALYSQAVALFNQLQQVESTLLPAAQKNLSMAKQAYQQGQLSLLEVVQAQRQLVEISGGHLSALAEFQQAKVRLYNASNQWQPNDVSNSELTGPSL